MAANFCSTIYLAGLKECYETKHSLVRFLWIMCSLSGLGLTVFFMYNIIIDYNNNPTVTKVYFDMEQEKFPEVHLAITFDEIFLENANFSWEAISYLKSLGHSSEINKSLHDLGKEFLLDYSKRTNRPTLNALYNPIKSQLDRYVNITCRKCVEINEDMDFVQYNKISKRISYVSLNQEEFGVQNLDSYRMKATVFENFDENNVTIKQFQFHLSIGNDFSIYRDTDNKLDLLNKYEYSIWINAKRVKRYNKNGETCSDDHDFANGSARSYDLCKSRCFLNTGKLCLDCTFVTQAETYNLADINLCSTLIMNVDQCMKKTKDYYSQCVEKCLPKCTETYYELNVFTSMALDASYVSATFKLLYLKSGVLTFEEMSSYTFWSAVSNIGGQMGLWLGLCIQTIVQVILYFVNFLFDKMTRK